MRSIIARLIPASGYQDATTSPSAGSAFVSCAIRVHRIPRPTSVTIAIRPSWWARDARKSARDLPDVTSEIACDPMARRANHLAAAKCCQEFSRVLDRLLWVPTPQRRAALLRIGSASDDTRWSASRVAARDSFCARWRRISARGSGGSPSRTDRRRSLDGNVPDLTTGRGGLPSSVTASRRSKLASLVGATLLGEPLRWNLLAGIVTVFVGIWIATGQSRRS
jgi:hypothetical protein